MENTKSPNTIKITSYKKISKINLSNQHHNSIIKKKYKINTNPLIKTLRNSPLHSFDNKKFQNNLSSLNITDKDLKTTKNKFFKKPKKYIVSAINLSSKDKNINKFNLKNSANLIKKSPINLKNDKKIIIKFIKNYPKTYYQKISNSIEKMKIQTDKTLEAMKKNLEISNREVFHRTTSVINIHRIKKPKHKKTKIIKKENILNLTNSHNKEEHVKLDYSEITKKVKNLSKSLKIFPYSEKHNKKKNIISNSSRCKDFSFNNYTLLGLSKIPNASFINVKCKPFYIPLFKNLEINRNNCYKNMYHLRSFEMDDRILLKNINKIYGTPNILVGLTAYEKEPDIQLRFIINKIKLLLDNIRHFKSNFMINKEFRAAFINMENPVKADYNYILEELCVLIIRIIPQLLKDFYNIIDQLLFINIPELDNEMKKKPKNEIECLKYNIKFFNKVTDYFSACVDIFNVIQKQIAEFKYTSNEFHPLNKNLDLARFDSSCLISMAEAYIEKTKNDQNVFTKFEIGLNLKKKIIEKKEDFDDFERFHRRRRMKLKGDSIKLERINSALNLAANGMKKDTITAEEKRKKINLYKTTSILNSSLIKDMMKYFQDNIKAKIISQQVIERFKTKELKRISNFENNDSNNEI